MSILSPYRKFLMAVVGAALVALQSFYSNDVLTGAEIMQTIFMALGTGVAYVLPNAPGAPFVKAAVMAVVGALEILIAATEAGEDYNNALWINVLIVILSTLGLIGVKNEPEPAVPPTASLQGTH